MIYEINNHNHVFDIKPGQPVFKQMSDDPSDISEAIAFDNFNRVGVGAEDSLKPPAGITSVSSQTEGSLGAIKRTTVEFVVHNFADYDKIYSRYFLKPGALIFVDFGWDTGGLYNPKSVVDETMWGSFAELITKSNERWSTNRRKGSAASR